MLGSKRGESIDHDDAVRAVVGILGDGGMLAVTPERFAEAVGLPPRRVEVDLDALIAEAFQRLSVSELAEVRRKVLAFPSPAEQLRALLVWLATPPQDSDAIRLEAWALSRRNPALRAAVRDNEEAWHSLVAAVIRRGARSGEFLQADADEVAAQVISLIDGINAYQLIGYRSDFDRMRLLTRVLHAELGLVWGPELLDALAPEPPA